MRPMMRTRSLVILGVFTVWVIAGCQEAEVDLPPAEGLTIHTTTASAVLLATYSIPCDVEVVETDDPAASAAAGGAGRMHVAVVDDLDCLECYELAGEGAVYEVHGDAPLGVQYGLTHLLELWGFRFFHPVRAHAPEQLLPLDEHGDFGVRVSPEMGTRGLHLHTLHPIEGLWAMWDPDEESLQRATEIVDWTVKSRGNYLQWVALEDILDAGARTEEWTEHTAAVNAVAHERGLRTGVGIQLFGSGNLQQAFDLIDGEQGPDEQRESIEERLALFTGGAGFDRYNLSFGEFFGEEPQAFIDAVDLTYEVLLEQQPDAEMMTVIHVGNYEDLQVEYDGQTLQYYFLTQFAHEDIVPWVHSVMYFNLFEDAGGAYLHDEFDEHRQFLLDRLAAGEPVGYFPESAYWCAFDSPVPTYLPLYVRSRWLDLDQVRVAASDGGYAGLDEHVLFSSGWEWGYWQNDYATLRMNHTLADDWESYVEQMYEPFGEDGSALAAQIIVLTAAQHHYLLEGRLAGYLAGRDAVMDMGYAMGIVSQPQRVTLEELAEMDETARAAFDAAIVQGLSELSEATWAIDGEVQLLATSASNRWFDEVADGVRIDALRTDFAHALYSAALAYAATGSDDGWLAVADGLLGQAREVVDARHADLHDPDPERLIAQDDNATIYRFGFLGMSDELCFWHKERGEAAQVIEGSDEIPPGCAL
jgi:hypothetical protein